MSARWARKTENGKKKENVKEKARKLGEKLQKKGYITSVRLGSRETRKKGYNCAWGFRENGNRKRRSMWTRALDNGGATKHFEQNRYLRLKDLGQNATEKEDQCGCRVEEKVTEMGDQLVHKIKQNAIKVLSIFYKSKFQGQHQREQFLPESDQRLESSTVRYWEDRNFGHF